MSLAIVNPVTLGAPPAEPICRSAEDPGQPCTYAGSCHEARQRLHHYEGLRGNACWFFQQMAAKREAETPAPIADGAQVRESEVAP